MKVTIVTLLLSLGFVCSAYWSPANAQDTRDAAVESMDALIKNNQNKKEKSISHTVWKTITKPRIMALRT